MRHQPDCQHHLVRVREGRAEAGGELGGVQVPALDIALAQGGADVARVAGPGIVHHSAYIVWFEAGRIAWLDAVGVPYAEIAAAGYHFAVIGVEVDYRTPARFGDTVRGAPDDDDEFDLPIGDVADDLDVAEGIVERSRELGERRRDLGHGGAGLAGVLAVVEADGEQAAQVIKGWLHEDARVEA